MRGMPRFNGAINVLRKATPRRIGTIAAGLTLAWFLVNDIANETPVGRLTGHVAMSESGKPLPGSTVVLVPIDADSDSRETQADSAGNFLLTRVPAGAYYLQAATRAHEVRNCYVNVNEGETTEVTLSLSRSQPELELGQVRQVFATSEAPYLAVKGYMDNDRDALKVTVYKSRLSNVLSNRDAARQLDAMQYRYGGQESQPLPAGLLHPSSGVAPALAGNKAVGVPEADLEGYFHKRIPLGASGAGLYLVEVTHGKFAVSAYLLVTDTAMVVKRAGTQALAYTANLQTGVPVSSCSVAVYKSGVKLNESTTDGNGMAEMRLPSTSSSESAKYMFVAVHGNDEAVVGGDGYQPEGFGNYTVHSYTDRPIYRPGQRINYKGIVRKNVDPGSRYSVPDGAAVTVELRSPSNERIMRTSTRTNAYGSYNGSIDLSSETPTGNYTLVSSVGGEEHTDYVTVASYRKPEYQVTAIPVKNRYVRGDTIEMKVSAQYYFGSPLAGAKVHYSIGHDTDWSAEYPDDYEYDPSDDTSGNNYGDYSETWENAGEVETEGDLTLDNNGIGIIRFALPKSVSSDEPQAETYTFYITVTDDANRESSAEGSVSVTGGDVKLGVSPEGYVSEPGKPMNVGVTAMDYDGHRLPNQPVQLTWGYSKYDTKKRSNVFTPIGNATGVTGPDGRAWITVLPSGTGNMRIQASTRDSTGREIRARSYVWVTGDTDVVNTEYGDLTILTDKRHYAPGETARVAVASSRTGQSVLMTVEGNRIYKSYLLPMTRKCLVTYVPVLAEYGPNVYICACYVKDKHFASSQAPLRVTIAERQVNVSVTPDKPAAGATLPRYHPNDKISYLIRTTNSAGKPVQAEFSLGVVDEAIYALKKDNPEELMRTFYPHRSNGVQTSYSFMAMYMGDADKSEPQITARKRFPDTAYWKPDLKTDAQGKAVVSFKLPDNLTTWRATVMAQTLSTAFGFQTSKVLSNKDFMVRIDAPRFFTQKDQSRLMAIVQNETGARQTALIRLRADGLVTDADTLRTIRVEPGGSASVTWPITADRPGNAKILVTAWTPKLPNQTQYTDGVEINVPVRAHGREKVEGFAGELTTRQPEAEVLRLDPTAIPETTRLTIRITPSVAGSLLNALDYLVGYPYGCTEQTLSRILPDIQAQRVLRFTKTGALAGDKFKNLPKMVRDGLTRLYTYQHKSGGWGWWQTDDDNPWMTAYVLYGLATAKANGYEVSQNALAKGKNACAKLLSTLKDEQKPFMLYALALSGEKKIAQTVRNNTRLSSLDSEALAFVVLLDKALGNNTNEAMEYLNRRAVFADGMLHWATANNYDYDDTSTTAVALRAMIAANPADPRIEQTLRWLMWRRTDSYWLDTRCTSEVATAICDYLAIHPAVNADQGEVNIRVNGAVVQTLGLSGTNFKEPELVLRVPHSSLRPGKNDIQLERKGGTGVVFYSVELKQTVAMEDMPAIGGTYAVKREYFRLVQRKTAEDRWTNQTEPTNNMLRQGDNIRVRLVFTVPRDMAYVLIEDAFPSGCEVTERGGAQEMDDWSYWWSNTDIRDDRIAFFMTRLQKGKHVIEYNLRAQTPGIFHVMPTLLQAMYSPETRAESAETRIEIR